VLKKRCAAASYSDVCSSHESSLAFAMRTSLVSVEAKSAELIMKCWFGSFGSTLPRTPDRCRYLPGESRVKVGALRIAWATTLGLAMFIFAWRQDAGREEKPRMKGASS